MNEEIHCIDKEKQPRMNGKIMTLTFFYLYAVKIRYSFSILYLLTCLNKDK